MNESTTALNSAWNGPPKSMFTCAPPVGSGTKITPEAEKIEICEPPLSDFHLY